MICFPSPLVRCVGVEADQWERGKPLPPMPGMQQQYDNRRGGPPPGMAMGGRGGAMAQLHKTGNAYKVRGYFCCGEAAQLCRPLLTS